MYTVIQLRLEWFTYFDEIFIDFLAKSQFSKSFMSFISGVAKGRPGWSRIYLRKQINISLAWSDPLCPSAYQLDYKHQATRV